VPQVPGRFFLQTLIQRRTLLYQLVRRDFQQRFVGSVAGWLWGVIHPLVLLLSWTFVFQICLKVTLPRGEVTQNYTLFLFCGFLPWLLFQETVLRSANCLVEHANLITKSVFPSEILPITIFLSSLIHHLIAVSLVTLTILAVLGKISPMIALLPWYIVVVGLFAIGLGWIVSSLQVYLRDTAQVVSVMLTLWFWVTPIFLSPEQIPAQFQFLVRWNPMSYIVRGYQDRLLSGRLPGWEELLLPAAAAGAMFIAGGLFFRYMKRGFADVL
jgi:ABC-type polysaccharide/polyol phosphate export permease